MQTGAPRKCAALAIVLASALFCGCGSEAAARDDTPETGEVSDAGTPHETGSSPDADAGPRDRRSDPSDAGDADQPLGPPYPIVLAHGMFGFEHLADVDQLPYYYGVTDALEADGQLVLTTEVDPFNNSTVRGEQLAAQIADFLKESGYAKVNIISHSQGGLDARWVAHHHPEWVASVVTISAPHGGTDVADVVLELVESDRFQDLVDALIQLVGKPLYDEVGNETSLFESLRQFSQPGIEKFNDQITDQPGVFYASIAGRTDKHEGGFLCRAADSPAFIETWEDDRDPVSPLLRVSEIVVSEGTADKPNDGLVRVEQAMWGEFLGCIPADHLDEVGQLLGDEPGGDNDFDHLQFYRGLVAYLHGQGL